MQRRGGQVEKWTPLILFVSALLMAYLINAAYLENLAVEQAAFLVLLHIGVPILLLLSNGLASYLYSDHILLPILLPILFWGIYGFVSGIYFSIWTIAYALAALLLCLLGNWLGRLLSLKKHPVTN